MSPGSRISKVECSSAEDRMVSLRNYVMCLGFGGRQPEHEHEDGPDTRSNINPPSGSGSVSTIDRHMHLFESFILGGGRLLWVLCP